MTTLSHVFDEEQMQQILSEFSRLGEKCYLDNAGTVLYPNSLLARINNDLSKNVYMNPHTDAYTADCISQIRTLILNHFNTNSTEYSVIFTSGATQGLKLITESFQFASLENSERNCGSFIYLEDNHTSVIGLREIAKCKKADVHYVPFEKFNESLNIETKQEPIKDEEIGTGNTLFAFPAQSSFNGYKFDINCISNLKNGCLNSYLEEKYSKSYKNWFVLLDAASYVANCKLDLSQSCPDFVCISFYKIFGLPTGLGAVLVKNSSSEVLREKMYFGGGTVDVLLSSEDYHVKSSILHERFEDGTPSFLSIIMLKHAFDTMHDLIPKVVQNDLMTTIRIHTFELARDFYTQLLNLKHKNGRNVAVLYMDSDFSDINKQGAVVTFNLQREDESYIGYSEFKYMADLFGITIRTGCFCNVGPCHRHLNLTNKEVMDLYNAGNKCNNDVDLISGRPTGCIRASFAYYNTFNDVDKIIQMICKCYVKCEFVKPTRKMIKSKEICDINKKIQTKYLDNKPSLLRESTSDYRRCNLTDKYNKEIHSEVNNVVLKKILIYPIKSCAAFKVNSAWNITRKGLEYDREWMIVKDNGVCLTQKQNNRMCLIRPVVDLGRNVLVLNFPDKDPITVPLIQKGETNLNSSLCQSKVCTDIVKAYDCGDKAADWVSQALEISYLRLIRQCESDDRIKRTKSQTNQKPLSLSNQAQNRSLSNQAQYLSLSNQVDHLSLSDQAQYLSLSNQAQNLSLSNQAQYLSLSNQAQYLLVNKASVRWLLDHTSDPTFMESVDSCTERFRANLIVDCERELIEQDWRFVAIGKHMFKVDGPCSRCQMVCIDQQTGEKTVEPLRTISELFCGKIKFGIYLSYVGNINGYTDTVLTNNSPVFVLDSID